MFAEEEVALALRHRGRDFLLNLGAEGEDFELALEEREQATEALLDGGDFEVPLALLEVEVQVLRDEVGEARGGFLGEGVDFDLVGERGREADDLLEELAGVAGERGQLDGVFHHVGEQLDARAQIRLLADEFLELKAPQAFDEDAHGVVGELQHLEHAARAAVGPQLVGLGLLHLGLGLEHEAHEAVAADHIVNELDALCGLDEQRRDHAGEEHDVREAEDGQHVGQRLRARAEERGVAPGGGLAGVEDADEFGVGHGRGKVVYGPCG